MHLLLVAMNRASKFIILALTLELFFVFSVSNLISVFGQALGGTSTSSVNDYDNNNNDNNTTSRRTGNTTNMTAGGLSASSVGNGAIVANRTGNTTNMTAGGLSASSALQGANSK
jgi:hypothetical protein